MCAVTKHLVGQAGRREREVEQRDDGGDLGQVVRVAQRGRGLEPEVWAVLHRGVAQPDEVHAWSSDLYLKQTACRVKFTTSNNSRSSLSRDM